MLKASIAVLKERLACCCSLAKPPSLYGLLSILNSFWVTHNVSVSIRHTITIAIPVHHSDMDLHVAVVLPWFCYGILVDLS